MRTLGVFIDGVQMEGLAWNELSPEQEDRAYAWAREKWGPDVELRELTDGEWISLVLLGSWLAGLADDFGATV